MKKVLLVVLVLIVAAVAGYEIISVNSNIKQLTVPAVVESTTTNSGVVSTGTSTGNQTGAKILSTNEANTIQVQWSEPIKISVPKIFKKASEGYDYASGAVFYKVGTVISGPYQGGDVLYGNVDFEMETLAYSFIQQNGKITYLNKLSDYDPLDPNLISIDLVSKLPDLTYPNKITYGTSTFTLEGDGYGHFGGFDFFNFDSNNIKLVFVDPKLGNVYTDNLNAQTANKSLSNGFYLKAPDGTTRVYSLDVNFYDKDHNIPDVTWNNGLKNVDEYTYTDRGGCGSSNYASVQNELTLADFNPAGTTSKGGVVYELKDLNSPVLKNIYNNDYNPYATPKISYAEFVNSKPVFFWVDSLGRIIKFQKYTFIAAAECGKPVIYLYPKTTTDVSVKIAPVGGLTKSEPTYENGWNVKATSAGELTDLATGKNYSYLFWEGRGGLYETPTKGFVVENKDVHSFLEEKLSKLGLNVQERADFIEFWEPRMTGSPYFFVTFLGNNEMNAIAPLEIMPKPDTIIRILMDFIPLEKPVSVQGYDIKTPERNGFTVVEWGGVLR